MFLWTYMLTHTGFFQELVLRWLLTKEITWQSVKRYGAPPLSEDVKMASESAAEEAQLELDQLLKQFEDWLKENTGGWKDFLKSNKDEIKVKRVNFNAGWDVEDYADLIDTYVRKINVLESETLTKYINRIRAAEKKAND